MPTVDRDLWTVVCGLWTVVCGPWSVDCGPWTLKAITPMFDNVRPVTLSPRACEEIRHIMKTKGIPEDYGLRVGVRGGGCGGMALMIGFDKRKEADLSYVVDGITVYVDKKHTMYLINKRVDFVDESDARGFTFVEEAPVER
jgi:iron-sulfur cluster assembly protein